VPWSQLVSGSGQTGPGRQAPPVQLSPTVQALLSALHPAPSAFGGFEQVPPLHVPTSWHWSGAGHWTGFPPTHVPAMQVSLCVQALPSLQVVPFVATGFEHTPFAGLHVPAVWH
jgi:hypothetical protein